MKAGDGGAKFRSEWPEVDAEKWRWIKENNIDPATGNRLEPANASSCGPQLGIAGSSGGQAHAVVDVVMQQRDAGQGWMSRHKWLLAGSFFFFYVLMVRIFGEA